MNYIVEKIMRGRSKPKWAIRDMLSGLYYHGGKWGQGATDAVLFDTPGAAHTELKKLEEQARQYTGPRK